MSVPLLGAGVAGLSPEDSFRGLLEGYRAGTDGPVPATVVFVVYKEAQLSRSKARSMVDEFVANEGDTWTEEPWPMPRAHTIVS